MEYKCPCCSAALIFGEDVQKMTCEYCDNTFDLDTVKEFNDVSSLQNTETISAEETTTKEWNEEDQAHLACFTCPACGGEIISDENTAATFCPYCDNPAILPGRLSGGLRPDAVIPFSTGKDDAKKAFLSLCKGKPLLPKDYANEQTVEKITGIYVPYWLYDCDGDQDTRYRATRIRRWSDSQYNYTRTDHFLLHRAARAQFSHIPMDGSRKLDDTVLESIEPYDFSKLTDFDTAYLSGFLADKYDVPSEEGHPRVKQRVGSTIDEMIAPSLIGYHTAVPTSKQLQVHTQKAKYALLPVWFLHSKYRGKDYIFAMNGQTGKMTGTLPVCPKRSFAWFAGIMGAVALIAALIQFLAL